MTYAHPGGATLDYQTCRYGKSRLLVRGPRVKLTRPYVVFFGGTETYGRFVARPFPQRLAEGVGLRAVNLSCINAGVDAFAEDRALLAISARAEATVVQVLGAANLSNDYFTVHPRRNDRFLSASPALSELYPEVDFTDFNFTRHLLGELEMRCPDRFGVVVAALKERWLLQMRRLLAEAEGRCILLWISEGPPPDIADSVAMGRDPLLIDSEMLNEIGAFATDVVLAFPSQAALSAGTEGMVYTDFDAHIAAQTMNDVAQQDVADALLPILSQRTAAA